MSEMNGGIMLCSKFKITEVYMESMPEAEKTDWCFTFVLSEPVSFKNLVSSDQIKFVTDANPSSKKVTGYEILVRDQTEEVATLIAGRRARRIVQIISLLIGIPVVVHHTASRSVSASRWTGKKNVTMDAILVEELDLDVTDSRVANIIHQDDALAERFHHAYWGLRAASDRHLEAMIVQFYQAIERVLPQAAAYEHLRNAISHPELHYAKTRKALQDTFDFTSKGHFDYNSPRNFKLLNSKAQELQKIARNYLKELLGK
jgi:hypothetical protein